MPAQISKPTLAIHSVRLTTLATVAAALGKKVNLKVATALPKISIPQVNFFHCAVRAPTRESNFSKNKREPEANRLTFSLTSDSAECKINEITGKTVNYSFRSITRNITRLNFLAISRCFIWVFEEPGFLLSRRSLVRDQVEEPQ